MRFNRALIAERLHLYDLARRHWEVYLSAERSPRWRDEARAHLRGLATRVRHTNASAMAILRGPLSSDSRDVQMRLLDPGMRRELTLELLGDWGREYLAGNSRASDSALRIAIEVARYSPSWLQASVQGVVKSTTTKTVRGHLARGLALYQSGFASLLGAAYDSAVADLAMAARLLRPELPATARWAAHYLAVAKLNVGTPEAADSILRSIDVERQPSDSALVGKIEWSRGLIALRAGKFERAAGRFRFALALMTRLDERENTGMLHALLAECYRESGEDDAASREHFASLALLAPFRDSRFLVGALLGIATLARDHNLPSAALAVSDDLLALRSIHRRPFDVLWLRASRGSDLAAIGRLGDARREFNLALTWTDSVMSAEGRSRLRADVVLQATHAKGVLTEETARREAANVARSFAVGGGIGAPRALTQLARLSILSNDTLHALNLLGVAIRQMGHQAEGFVAVAGRRAFVEELEDVYDEMIKLQFAVGRTERAFDYLEQLREAVGGHSDGGRGPHLVGRIAELQHALPPSGLAVLFAVLDDRVLSWTIAKDHWYADSHLIARSELSRLAEQFMVELRAAPGTIAPANATLYALLIRPIEAELLKSSRLFFFPDRELASVPFSAVRDPVSRRYLVEVAPVVTVPSVATLSSLSHRTLRSQGRELHPLVVGSPAFDRGRYAQLEPLPGADDEADSIAALYRNADILSGQEATSSAVLRSLRSHDLFHFAGHAILNTVHPDESTLILASEPRDIEGLLPAREIRKLRLSNLELVVLSACQTLGARPTHTSTLSGLAASFLDAGVSSAVSSLWVVNDRAAVSLLREFHEVYAMTFDAGRALQTVQIRRIHSSNTAPPASWAGFVFTGR